MNARRTEDSSQSGSVEAAPIVGAVIATLQGVTREGEVRVAVPGHGVASARVLASVSRDELLRASAGRELLVMCANGDPSRPVVIGLLEDPAEVVLSLAETREVIAERGDSTHRVFSAEGSISLVCGEASLTLHADGRVVTRGVNVVSVASEQQRIQGAIVRIN